MRNDGEMMWYATFSGVNAGPATAKKMDRCFGIVYDPTPGNTGLSVLIQGKMTNLRETTFKKGDFYDTMLVSLDMNGRARKSVTISFADTLYDTYLANNGLLLAGKGRQEGGDVNGRFVVPELSHFWAGWSYGFSTRRNKLKKSTTAPDFDVFTFKFNFDDGGYNCLWSQEYDASAVRGIMSIKSQSEIASNGIYSLFDDDTKVRKSRKNEYFIPYASRYSGGFALLDTMKIPRPCAYKSLNLTGQEYYRGQKTLDYKITSNNRNAFGVTLLDGNTKMIYQDGKNATDLAKFNRAKYSVGI
jgi:hypothetical protein